MEVTIKHLPVSDLSQYEIYQTGVCLAGLLYVSIRHNFISLTSVMGIQNSIRILYKTSLLTES